MSVKTYDPGQIAVIFGPNIISGFGEGSLVKVARAEKSFKTHVGGDGEVSRTRNRNRSGTMTFTLKRTSASNDILAAALEADELLGTGIAPASVTDLLGTTRHFAANAWVDGPAEDDLDVEGADREWTIACGDLDVHPGGSIITAP
jgi:hypothetical protein